MRRAFLVLVVLLAMIGCNKADPEPQAQPVAKPAQHNPAQFQHPPGWEFVHIPAGTFMMGSPSSEQGRRDDREGPQHQITLTHDYYLGTTEVTQSQYEELMGSNPSEFKGSGRPVETVSWDDAQASLVKLNERERRAGRLPEDWEYRLPTEAEWEYAARAGTTTAYSFGSDVGQLERYAWFCGNSWSGTHAVGGKDANPWGLYDMHGNVDEWCQDWFGAYPSESQTDPTGPSTGYDRVMRGGSWVGDARFSRSAYRFYFTPGDRYFFLGLRVLAVRRQGQ